MIFIHVHASSPSLISMQCTLILRTSFAAVWLQFEETMRSWAVKFGTIHVMVGSVLDANRDGERDNDGDYTWWVDGVGGVAVPTHFYAVVVKCVKNGVEPAKCNPDQLDAVGLLFQHPTEIGVSRIIYRYRIYEDGC